MNIEYTPDCRATVMRYFQTLKFNNIMVNQWHVKYRSK